MTTIEGLSANNAHPIQQAWAAEQVTQCGRCDPGYLMALAALLETNPAPGQAELDRLPNRCRCGAGPRIVKAVQRVATAARPAASGSAEIATAGGLISFSIRSSAGAKYARGRRRRFVRSYCHA